MINSNQSYDFCCQEHCWGFHKIPMFRRNYPKSWLMTLQVNFSHRTTTWADCEQLPLTCFGNTSRFHVQTRTHLFIRVFQQLTLYQSIFWLFREKYEMSMGAKAGFHTNSARPDKMNANGLEPFPKASCQSALLQHYLGCFRSWQVCSRVAGMRSQKHDK